MRGIKIPQYEFALKMQGGGLMREGGRICGTLRYTYIIMYRLVVQLEYQPYWASTSVS